MSLGLLYYLKRFRVQIVVVLIPLCLLPLPLTIQNKESLAAYLVLLMGIFWCSEIVPLSVTALMPVVFWPLFGILTTGEVCAIYMRDIIMLLAGGIIMAVAVENVNLHRRIGIKALLLIGFTPRWLILGFMLPAWFLSMWISNTAATAMMMPIVDAVLEQLRKPSDEKNIDQTNSEETDMSTLESNLESHAQPVHLKCEPGKLDALPITIVDPDSDPMKNLEGQKSSFNISISKEPEEDPIENEDKALKKKAKGMILCVAFAANVGGTGTLIGTPPNLIVQGASQELWKENGMEADAPISFTSWMVYGLPIAIISLLVLWIWLNIYYIGIGEFCGCKNSAVDDLKEKAVRKAIEKEYGKLGKISGSEICVLGLFGLCVALWFFRRPLFMPGWGDLFLEGYVTDAVPAVLIVLIMFVVPQYPNKEQRNTWENKDELHTLLDWHVVNNKFPWGIIFIMGGGLALGEGVMVSGLAQWLGEQLLVFSDLPGPLIVTLISLFSSGITQVMSNTATCTLFMPIVTVMALNMNYNPLYLMLPVGIACSFALLLPVATPPNAIAYGTGRITVLDMIKAGIVPNLLLLPVVTLATQTWGWAFFNLGEIPWDTNMLNGTTTSSYMTL